MYLICLISVVSLGLEVVNLMRWQQRDNEYRENRRRIERLESLLLERAK
jgi:hypothetical protein